MKPKTITVGELRELLLKKLCALPDDALVSFGGGVLTPYRLKPQGPESAPFSVVDVEFNEVFTVNPLD